MVISQQHLMDVIMRKKPSAFMDMHDKFKNNNFKERPWPSHGPFDCEIQVRILNYCILYVELYP